MWKMAILGTFLLAAPAWAQQRIDPATILDPLLGTQDFRHVAKSSYEKDGVRHISGLVLRSESLDIGIGSLRISRAENGNETLNLDAISLFGKEPNAPRIQMGGLSVEIERFPDPAAEDRLCAWLDVVRALRIDQIEALFPKGSGYGLADAKIRNLGYELKGQDIPDCHVSGLFSMDSAEVDFQDRSAVSIETIRSDVRLPMSVQAAGHEGSGPGLRFQMGTFEFRNGEEFPVLGMNDLSLDADFNGESLIGIIGAFDGGRFFAGNRNGQAGLISLINGVSGLDGNISIRTDRLRILTPGVVPPEAVANFSRVGLSTIHGATDIGLVLRRGVIGADLDMALNGLFDVRITATFGLEPYSGEKVKLAQEGRDLGIHMTPDISVMRAQLDYVDRGLEHYVIDLTGIPTGRNIEEFGKMMIHSSTESLRETVAVLVAQLASFFRFAGDGMEMQVNISPDTAVSIPEILLVTLRNASSLADILGVRMTVSAPAMEP